MVIEVVGAVLCARKAALLRMPAVDAPRGRTDFFGGILAAGIGTTQCWSHVKKVGRLCHPCIDLPMLTVAITNTLVKCSPNDNQTAVKSVELPPAATESRRHYFID